MGLRKEYTDFIRKNAPVFQKKMLELGNQIIKDPENHDFHNTGKDYFGSLGCLHVSMDINGLDGAITYNLGSIIKSWNNFFDIVINSGFSICVDNYTVCYNNIYNMCKPGGIMIHILPCVGSNWCANHFVNRKFFDDMCFEYGCKIIAFNISKGVHGNLVFVAMEKLTKGEYNKYLKDETQPEENITKNVKKTRKPPEKSGMGYSKYLDLGFPDDDDGDVLM